MVFEALAKDTSNMIGRGRGVWFVGVVWVFVVGWGRGQVQISPEQLQELIRAGRITPQEAQALISQERRASNSVPTKLPVVPEDTVLEEKMELVEGVPTPSVAGAVSVWGMHIFRESDIKAFALAKDVRAPEDYVLGPGDEIIISVWGAQEFNSAYQIDDDGYIYVEYVGRIYLKGLTFADAKSMLSRRLSQIFDFTRSQLAVSLNYSRVIPVNVVGEVRRPGTYVVPAINTAFNMLYVAGGVTDVGSLRRIYVKRAGRVVDSIDIYRILLEPEKTRNVYMQYGDFVHVPVQGRVVKIDGAVRRPHRYELAPGEHLRALLHFCGGLLPNAYARSVKVMRYVDTVVKIISVNLDSLLRAGGDFELRDGDMVIVPALPDEPEEWVESRGAFRIPQRVPYVSGMSVADLVAMSGGLKPEAFTERFYVLRLRQDYSREVVPVDVPAGVNLTEVARAFRLENRDIVVVLSRESFVDSLWVYVYGLVRNPTQILYTRELTLGDALLQAGGLKPEAERGKVELTRIMEWDAGKGDYVAVEPTVVTFEVGANLVLDKQALSFKLNPYDRIVVRKEKEFRPLRAVDIVGEVAYPGTYPLVRADERLVDVIERAGGLLPWAYPEGARLYRAREGGKPLSMRLDRALKNPRSIFNVVLEGGDSIVIPRLEHTVRLTGYVALGQRDTLVEPVDIIAPYVPGKRAVYYIKAFGNGFVKKSWRSRAYVMLPNGELRPVRHILFVRVYPRVVPMSTVYVPAKPEKPREQKQKEPVDIDVVLTRLGMITQVSIQFLSVYLLGRASGVW